MHEGFEPFDEEATPVNGTDLAVFSHRMKSLENKHTELVDKHGALADDVAQCRLEIGVTTVRLGDVGSKLDHLVAVAITDRQTREARAHTSAENEKERSSKWGLGLLAVLAPTLAAIGALIASIVAASR